MLARELPELVAYVRAGLTPLGREDLIADIEAAGAYDVKVGTHGASIYLVPDLDLSAMMAHPDRERVGLGAPRGVPRRRWGISLDVIDGRTWLLGIAYPGSLREPLRELARRLSTSRVIPRR